MRRGTTMDMKAMYKTILSEYEQVFEKIDQDKVRDFIETVKSYHRIFLIGVGREGMATRAFAMRLMHMGKEIHWIWDDTTTSLGKGEFTNCYAGRWTNRTYSLYL